MSTDLQLKGDSLRRQKDLSQSYAQKRGLELQIDAQYRDIGMSAYSGAHAKKGAFKRFLDDVEAGKIEAGSYLLVESLDRLSRQDVATALTPFLALIEAGIIVITLIDGAEYSKATVGGPYGVAPLMMSLMIMARAHEESRTKSARLAAAWSNKRAQMDRVKLTKVAPAWLTLSDDRTQFSVIEDRVAIVRKIFEDTKNGIGAVTIVRRLNEAKVPAFGRSQGWRGSYIKKILFSRTVLGEYQPYQVIDGVKTRLEAATGYYPAIVSEELFYAAEAARVSRRHRGGRKGKHVSNLFSGLLKCGYCGSTVYLYDKGDGPKGTTTLKCNAAQRRHGCEAAYWPYPRFESEFIIMVSNVNIGAILNDESTQSIIHEANAKLNTVHAKLRRGQEASQSLVSAIERSTSHVRAMAALEKRLDEVLVENDTLLDEAKALKETITQAETRVSTAEERSDELVALVNLMRSKDGDDLFVLRAKLASLIRDVIDRVDLYSSGYAPSDAQDAALAQRMRSSGYAEDDITHVLSHIGVGGRAFDGGDDWRFQVIKFRDGEVAISYPGPAGSFAANQILPNKRTTKRAKTPPSE